MNLFNCILEFIGGISQFSVKGDKESKLRCTKMIDSEKEINNFHCFFLVAFKIYDMDKDGFISNGKEKKHFSKFQERLICVVLVPFISD